MEAARTAQLLELRKELAKAEAKAEEASRKAEQASKRRASIDIALDPPPTWTSCSHGGVQVVDLDLRSAEAMRVVAHFEQTSKLAPRPISAHRWKPSDFKSVEVLSVSRVENPAMWRQFALLRREVIKREGATSARALQRIERAGLFHGCTDEVAASIMHQGFNRSYAGIANKQGGANYGRGTYLARDAGYSMSKRFAKRDECGVSCMLYCRLVVGEYCRGESTMITPPLRDPARQLLYDSTVDSVERPEIFVAFKDGQAYPEYLIKFFQPPPNHVAMPLSTSSLSLSGALTPPALKRRR